MSRAHRVAAAVAAGTVWIHAYKSIHVAVPFGGIRESGHGRSSGPGVLDEYTQQKAVWVPTTAPAAPFPSMRGEPAASAPGAARLRGRAAPLTDALQVNRFTGMVARC